MLARFRSLFSPSDGSDRKVGRVAAPAVSGVVGGGVDEEELARWDSVLTFQVLQFEDRADIERRVAQLKTRGWVEAGAMTQIPWRKWTSDGNTRLVPVVTFRLEMRRLGSAGR
jgi:hypothetical protein